MSRQERHKAVIEWMRQHPGWNTLEEITAGVEQWADVSVFVTLCDHVRVGNLVIDQPHRRAEPRWRLAP